VGDGEKADSEEKEKEKKEDSMYISTYKFFFCLDLCLKCVFCVKGYI
jgi:hypothetical protein